MMCRCSGFEIQGVGSGLEVSHRANHGYPHIV